MKVKIFRSAKNTGERLTEINGLPFISDFITDKYVVALDDTQTYQTHIGFGGALTESAAFTLSEMPEEQRNEVINAYYSREGLGYTLGRIHVNSCDFSLGNYDYVENKDKELKTFDISHEEKWVLPLIKDIEKVSGRSLKLLASPWSPSAWMKDNNDMNHGGRLLPEYKQTWADYLVKYILAMREKGVNIIWLSVQNEPAATQTWDSCIYTARDEGDFVRDYLGPTLEKAGLKDVNIIIWDHNRDIIIERASGILVDPDAARYVWGIGNHWYVSEEFGNLAIVHNMFPDKHILFTEGCIEGGTHPGEWHTGERYGRNIIGDFNNWSEGFLDWNITLNETGGPNHVNNFCDAPILCYRQEKELVYNSSYYYIGHFSKFIRPGAKRIGLSMNLPEKVYATAFKNTDGNTVAVIQNENDYSVSFTLTLMNRGINTSIPGHSITTFIIDR